MTTLSTLITEARLMTRTATVRSNLITDSSLVIIANRILSECRAMMVEVESNLVYSTGTITTAASTAEYSLSSLTGWAGFMDDGVWLDGEDWFLQPCSEEDKIRYDYQSSTNRPERYYITNDSSPKVGFLWVPDDAYTINCQFWVALTPLIDKTSTLPWQDIWNSYIEKRMEYAINSIYERDISLIAAELVSIEAVAMQEVYRRGIRHRRSTSDFFSVEGV